jgi:hypothetical protein
MKFGDAVSAPSAPVKLAKSVSVQPRALRKSLAEGSYDEHMKTIAPAVIAGSGCEHPPHAASGELVEPGSHWCSVIATFPDYALVECTDEDTVWKVPYTRDGDDVTVGEPEEMHEVFVPAGEDDEPEDDDSDSPDL